MSTSRADTKKWVEDFYNGIIDRNEYEDLFEKSFQAPHVEPPTPDFVAQTCTLKCNAPRSMQNEAKLYNVFINRKYAKDSTTMVYIRLRGSRDTNHIYFRDDVESGTKFGMLRGQNRFAALRKILSDKGQGVCQTALDSARVVLREFRGECLDHPEALELYVALGNKEEKCLKAQIHEMVQGVPKICDKLKSQDPKTRAQKVSEVYPGCTSEDVNNVLTYAKQGLFQKGSLSEEYSVQCVYDEKTDSNPVFSYMKNCVAPWAREYADFEKEQCVAHHILLRFGYDVALSNDDALMFQKFLLNKIYLLDHAEAKRKGRQIVQYCAKIKQRNDLAAKARKTEEDAKTLEALDADIGKYVHMFGELPLFERDDDTEATMILNKMIKFAESFIPEGFEKAPGSMSAISNHRSNIRSVDEDTKPSVGMQVRFRPEALRPELVERNPLLLSAAQGTVEKSGCDPPAESRDKLKLFSKKSLLFFAAMEKNVNRQKILQAQHRRAAGKTTVNKKMGARMPGSTTAPPDTPVKGAGARSSTADKTPPAMKVMKTAAMRNKMKMAKKKMMKKKESRRRGRC
ncbi:unnamed protein product [Amoebophrya sp. A25]|nr:unnamed protein product [Amoebophrya sp. A25]|eukprot:GSA25T00025118001.1